MLAPLDALPAAPVVESGGVVLVVAMEVDPGLLDPSTSDPKALGPRPLDPELMMSVMLDPELLDPERTERGSGWGRRWKGLTRPWAWAAQARARVARANMMARRTPTTLL